MQQPLVSVVIPTHNRLNFLKEAIASVKSQTFKEWELLIVDDASSDGTWEWLTELRDPQLHVFRIEKQSFREGACNRGLAEATGQFIMFFDDDDLLRQNALSQLVAPLNNNPDLVAVVGARWKFKDGSYALKIEHPIIPLKRIIWPDLLAGWSSVSGQNLYRSSAVKAVSGFSRDFYRVEDRDLWLRVARLGPVMLLPAIVLEYRAHGGQWRPEDIVELRERLFQEFISTLPAEEQPRGQRIRSSARQSQQAEENYRAGRYWAAFRHYAKACQAAPELAISPLTGPPLVRGFAKSLLRSLIKR